MSDLSWGEGPKQDDEKTQGSEAWLQWRGKGLGSSDAATLLGWSPWKKIEQLYEEKLGLWKPIFGPQQRSAMERGKELEPRIRHWYETNYRSGLRFKEDIATHPELEYLRASFDGINREFKNPEDGSIGRIIEIKAPNALDHALAVAGEVPKKYQPQVAWLMVVGNIPWCDYVSFGSDTTHAVVPVPADILMQAELRRRAELFWQHILTKTPLSAWEPWERPLTEAVVFKPNTCIVCEKEIDATQAIEHFKSCKNLDPPQITEQMVEATVAEALQAQKELWAAEVRFEVLKEKLKQIAGNKEETVCGEAVFGWNGRKGTIDYGAIPELIGLDLEQFRKPPTKVFYFKRRPNG